MGGITPQAAQVKRRTHLQADAKLLEVQLTDCSFADIQFAEVSSTDGPKKNL